MTTDGWMVEETVYIGDAVTCVRWDVPCVILETAVSRLFVRCVCVCVGGIAHVRSPEGVKTFKFLLSHADFQK